MLWNDARFIGRLKRREYAAFETVVESHYQSVFQQLWHFCHDEEVAADLTQETFAQAWKSLDSFAEKSSIRTWLYTIAARVWYSWNAGRANRENTVPLEAWTEALPDAAPNPAQETEARAQRENVQAGLAKLPSPFRETLVSVTS